MPLESGTILGPYQVTAKIGEGGMGEVYRATDTKLNRQVALKILPEAFASDPDRLARFQREAQVLASLNHPGIAAIHGIEESDGQQALVLELVEGPTLADRIARGPIPLDEALPIAKQIAEALEAAHEAGVIHRDLKPANIKVRDDGTVKVLDFGLAKALDPTPEGDPSQSPTLTAAATQMGVIMGTAAYMSPEQAAGKPTDKRSDIWSFGVVLYETLTGKRLFGGETTAHVLAAVLRHEPDWEALPQEIPQTIQALLTRCFERTPKRRLRDIGEAVFALGEATAQEPARQPVSISRGGVPILRRPALGVVGVGLVAAATAAAFWLGRTTSSIDSREANGRVLSANLTVDLSEAAPMAFDARASGGIDSPLLDISPDGTTLAYVGEEEGVSRLYVRRLDEFEVRVLEGTEEAQHPFFSPDGQSVGFLTADQVKVVNLSGGAPRVVSAASRPIVATWLADGWIYVGDNESKDLFRVSVDTGARQELASGIDSFGRVLPDGQHVLATGFPGSFTADHAEIRLVSLSDSSSRTLIRNGYDARYVVPGYIIFGRAGDLFASRFDLERLVVEGDPVRIASNVRMDSNFANVQAAVSETGVLAYAPGGDSALGRFAWIDREGATEFLPVEESLFGSFVLAPDGRRLAVEVLDVRDHILIHEVGVGDTVIRGEGHVGGPSWAPSNDKLAYTIRQPDDRYQVVTEVPNSGRPADVVTQGEDTSGVFVHAWLADNSQLVLGTWPRIDRFLAPTPASDSPLPPGLELVGEFENFVDLHPNGKWVALFVDDNIEVRSVADGRRYSVSTGFGIEPRWCHACDELFYRDGNRVFSVKVRTEPDFQREPPQLAFEVEGFINTSGRSFDISPDGQRLLVVKRVREIPRHEIQVVIDWAAELSES